MKKADRNALKIAARSTVSLFQNLPQLGTVFTFTKIQDVGWGYHIEGRWVVLFKSSPYDHYSKRGRFVLEYHKQGNVVLFQRVK